MLSKLESELSVTKQVNSLLSSRFVKMERQCWAFAQYSRQECIDIIGIPSEVGADVLEEKVVNIFGKLDCNILPNRKGASHSKSKERESHRQFFTQEGLPASFGCAKGFTEYNNGRC